MTLWDQAKRAAYDPYAHPPWWIPRWLCALFLLCLWWLDDLEDMLTPAA